MIDNNCTSGREGEGEEEEIHLFSRGMIICEGVYEKVNVR